MFMLASMPLEPNSNRHRSNGRSVQAGTCGDWLISIVRHLVARDKPPDDDRMQTRLWHSSSTGGLLLGTLFFAAF
jgi:hypothetical protein